MKCPVKYTLAQFRKDKAGAIKFQKTLERIIEQQTKYSNLIKSHYGLSLS